jgi:hypothetical protein
MPSGEVSRVTTNQKVTTVMLYVQLRHAPQLYLAADHDLPQQGRQPHRVTYDNCNNCAFHDKDTRWLVIMASRRTALSGSE